MKFLLETASGTLVGTFDSGVEAWRAYQKLAETEHHIRVTLP